jgi:deoxyribonuclease V
MWPSDADALAAVQRDLADATPDQWRPVPGPVVVAGCWVCFPRGLTGPGDAGDRSWAAAVVGDGEEPGHERVVEGRATAAYRPGLLALRVGPLLERVVRGLTQAPDVLLLDASGRDHPRGAGLALHLGAVLGLPTVGVTHRPLTGEGTWPADRRGATSPVRVGENVVGCWLRTQPGVRPLVVHPGWSVDLDTAIEVVVRCTPRRRTPEPLRAARQLARSARAAAAGDARL